MTFKGKWLPDSNDFRQECLKIAKDLTGFKKNPIYCRYINNDNRPKETALAFYNYIKQHYPELLAGLQLFTENDKVGDPTFYKIGGVNISPGTLRFMKVLGDLHRFPRVKSIVEIGGGYGGQRKIIGTWWDVDYTIIDIPESLEVSRAYLKEETEFMNCDWLTKSSADLVISDYCISELDKAGIDFYIDRVVKHCTYGYFTCNKIGATDHLIKRLDEYFDMKVTPETPKTSKHENIIIYATKKFNV